MVQKLFNILKFKREHAPFSVQQTEQQENHSLARDNCGGVGYSDSFTSLLFTPVYSPAMPYRGFPDIFNNTTNTTICTCQMEVSVLKKNVLKKKKTVVSFVVTFTPTGQACLKSHRYHPGCISLFLSQDKKLLWLNTDEEMKLSKCDRSWWMFRLGYLNQQCYDVHQIWVKVTSVPLGHVATCSLWFMEIVLTLLFH